MSNVGTTLSLDEVARQIEAHATKSDEHVLKAAQLLAEARRRIEGGEVEGQSWCEWAPKHIKLSLSRLRELQRIAEAENPQKELESLRDMNLRRVRKHRKRKADARAAADASSLEPERERLIDWAKTAPLDEVRCLLEHVASNDNVVTSAEESSAVEAEHAA